MNYWELSRDFVVVFGLFSSGAVWASHCGASRVQASVLVRHGLTRSAALGIFPDQGLNPCPLR